MALAGRGFDCEPHLAKVLQSADHQAAQLGVVRPLRRWPQIDLSQIIGTEPDFSIDPGPALCRDLAFERVADLVLRFRPQFQRDQLLGPRAQTGADVIARDHQVGSRLIDPAQEQMDMGIIGVPMIDRDPIEPCAQIRLHLTDQIAGEALEILELGSILRGDDETEMMAILFTAPREAQIIRLVARSIERHPRLPVPADALALQIGEVFRERRGPI